MMNRMVAGRVWMLTTMVAMLASQAPAGPIQEAADAGHDAGDVHCPVMGEPVNFLVSTPTPDGPVFFCCPRCIEKYKAAPEDFASKVDEQRDALSKLAKVQVICPVSGEPVDPKRFIERDSGRVYFCCGKCIASYEENPDRYREALANAYTYQTVCPVKGDQVNPNVFIETRAGRIYLCCKPCEQKLVSQPDRYLPNLANQGVTLTAADLASGHAGPKHADDDAHTEHGDHDGSGHDDHGDH